MIPTIPAYIITLVAVLLFIEYLGRALKTKPIGIAFLGEALIYLYLGVMYGIYYFFDVPSSLRHILVRYGIFLLLAYRYAGTLAEHYWQWKGSERRCIWLAPWKRKRQ